MRVGPAIGWRGLELGTGALIALLLMLPAPDAVRADDDSTTLTASIEVPAAPIPQGAPISYSIVVENAGPATVDTIYRAAVQRAGKPKVHFAKLSHTAAPGRSSISGTVTPAQWFAETGEFELSVEGTDGSAATKTVVVGPAVVESPRFEDVTVSAGLEFTHVIGSTCNGTHKAGAAWGDIEGDGDLDLFVPNQRGPAKLFVNRGGRFTDEAAARGAANNREGYGAVFADYDNDGDPDLFVTNQGPDRLLQNDGGGNFTDVGPALGVADPQPGSSASFADFDGDALLDLYVARWGDCSHEDYDRDSLYRQRPGGGFEDVTHLLGDDAVLWGRGFLGGWVDHDLDGDQDLYLANDFTLGPARQPNALWDNDQGDTGGFTNVTAGSGTGLAINSMGLAISDYDRDRDPDIAISNILDTKLLRNRSDGSFDEVGEQAGVARPHQRLIERAGLLEPLSSITWGLDFHDLNNDTWEDLYAAAGTMEGEPLQPNALFAGVGDGSFHDLSAPSGADDPYASRGVAFGDYDRDGRIDLYVVNRGGQPRLYRNVTPPGDRHWLQLELIGTASNRDACGARVVAEVSGESLSRWVHCGSTSLASGNQHALHFGLGEASVVDRLTIHWPSGDREVLEDIDAGALLEVTEGGSVVQPPDPPGEPGPQPGPGPDPDGSGSGADPSEPARMKRCGMRHRKSGTTHSRLRVLSLPCRKAKRVHRRHRRAMRHGAELGSDVKLGGWSCAGEQLRPKLGKVVCTRPTPGVVLWRWRSR